MPEGYSFTAYWLAETLRLREAHWGPLEDAKEVRRARADGQSLPQQILLRAQLLGRREKLDTILAQWRQGAKVALAAMLILAVLTGSGAALGALGDGSRSVNLPLALAGMLGLHAVTFLLWMLGLSINGSSSGAWLGQIWIWLTHKLARGPDATLAPRALVELLGRNGTLRWLLSAISHGVWTVALLGMLLTLVALLSARRYGFNWETTLLSPDTFVQMTALLGWLPAKLGFSIPSDDIVRASNGVQALPESAHVLWSSWLIGCVVVYGLIPRLAALGFSLLLTRRRIASLTLDVALPGYVELRERLQPTSERIAADSADGPNFQARIRPPPMAGAAAHDAMLVGIELPADTPWPPGPLHESIGDMGIIDDRAQRQALLDRLHSTPPRKLLIVCDGRQTPDRGTVALAADLASTAQHTRIVLASSARTPGNPASGPPRTPAWHQRLAAAGFVAEDIVEDLASGLAWLAGLSADAQVKGYVSA